MSFKGDYLRVLTPVTSDGLIPVTIDGQVQYREDHFDIKAKKMLEAKNAKLPDTLKKKIEVVSASVITRPARAVKAEPVDNFENEEETTDAAETEETPKTVTKQRAIKKPKSNG